jgi:hypothetical protein
LVSLFLLEWVVEGLTFTSFLLFIGPAPRGR